ncbi:MAG: radical SAM protein [Clostridia bacterium]|nr:radical SAM protein [Clostridia bacterium]
MTTFNLSACAVCPRECGVNRLEKRGYCGEGAEVRVSKIMLHHFEEPVISGKSDDKRGSGTIFFSGCPLHCIYCQNKKISGGGIGDALTTRQLADAMLRLEAAGAYNINLVTPTHFIPQIIDALDIAKPMLSLPVIFNTGGYEKAETIAKLNGYADIFLTDFKYGTSELAKAYSAAPDYPQVAMSALSEMYRSVGDPIFGTDGMMKRGIILRHLVLPGGRKDSMAALRLAAEAVDPSKIILSLMRQYTPEFAPDSVPALKRRITSFEYDQVLKEALSLGFDGFSQDKGSAQVSYTPEF